MVKKGKVTLIIVLSFLALALAAGVTLLSLFVLVDGKPIYRYAEELDLRDVEMTVDDFLALQKELPGCHIRWMIPIGGQRYDSQTTELTIKDLAAEDIELFSFFEQLQLIKAQDAVCYDDLIALQAVLPDCMVEWAVHLGQKAFFPSESVLDLNGSGVAPEELTDKLGYFTNLQSVTLTDIQLDSDLQNLLTAVFPETQFVWNVELCGKVWLSTTTELFYAGESPDAQELAQSASRLPLVDFIDLSGCGMSVEDLLLVQSAYDAQIVAEITLFDVSFTTQATQLNFNGISMKNTDDVERILPLMSKLERVEMCGCGISSENMDALWKRNPRVRFVWTVRIGRSTLRTDATSFIGAKHGYIADMTIANHFEDPYNRLFDKDCKEFKYCVDMVCLDLGHMGVSDYSFLQYMPKLKYLILADTLGRDFSYLEGLEELVFLELFLTQFSDTEVLLSLTNLKDLNISHTRVSDITHLKQMTWVERIWLSYSGVTMDKYRELCDALPSVQIDITAKGSTDNGWRKGKYYYEMRDYLGMYYLN